MSKILRGTVDAPVSGGASGADFTATFSQAQIDAAFSAGESFVPESLIVSPAADFLFQALTIGNAANNENKLDLLPLDATEELSAADVNSNFGPAAGGIDAVAMEATLGLSISGKISSVAGGSPQFVLRAI